MSLVTTMDINFVQAAPQVTVTIYDDIIDQNDQSLGFAFKTNPWNDFKYNNVQKQLAEDANFKLVWMEDYLLKRPNGACTWWNEATQSGTFDWSQIDQFVETIQDIGAEPIIVLSHYREPNDPNGWESTFPDGMAINPSTGLPYPNSYAAFAAAYVQHFKNVGLSVK